MKKILYITFMSICLITPSLAISSNIMGNEYITDICSTIGKAKACGFDTKIAYNKLDDYLKIGFNKPDYGDMAYIRTMIDSTSSTFNALLVQNSLSKAQSCATVKKKLDALK